MEDWDIAPLAANHWNRAIVVPPIFDPYTRAPKRRGKLECGGKRGTGSEKKAADMQSNRSLCASDSDEAIAYAKIRGHNQ